MALIVEFVVLSIIVSSVFGADKSPQVDITPILPNTYKDIFLGNQGGKPQLGTMKATCWARGGMCMHIRHCPPNKSFDTGVSGCSTNFKVCCKLFELLSPTVGIKRSRDEEEDIQEVNENIVKPGGSHLLMSLHLTM